MQEVRAEMNDLLRLEDDQEQRFAELTQRILQLSEDKETTECQLRQTEAENATRVQHLEDALQQVKFQVSLYF